MPSIPSGPSEEREQHEGLPLNNFRCFLPGGPYRGFYDKYPEKARIMDAIDELLTSEFSDIESQAMHDRSAEAGKLLTEMFDFANPKSEEEIRKRQSRMEELKQMQKEDEESLRPLFERLLEMGFSASDLTG